MKSQWLVGLSALVALFSWPNNVRAEDQVEWSIAPYIWASDTKLDLAFRDANIGSGDLAFDDVLDVLDAAFMIYAERAQGQWSVFTDITYLNMSDTNERQLITIDSDSKQLFVDAAVGYWPAGANGNLKLFGGVRYSGFDDRYDFSVGGNSLGTQRSSSDYFDALLGIHYRFKLSERWGLVTRGDLSFGDSEGTCLLRANFAYTVGKQRQNAILFGYQYKYAEFKDGDLTTTLEQMGPMLGFNFGF